MIKIGNIFTSRRLQRNLITGLSSMRFSVLRGFGSVTSMTDAEFERDALQELHEIADVIDSNIDRLDGDSVDLHEGVLTIEFPRGTFVINKHGASKQMWYSSPVTPPAYFEPRISNGHRWWSLRLEMTLREKLSKDIKMLTGKDIKLE